MRGFTLPRLAGTILGNPDRITARIIKQYCGKKVDVAGRPARRGHHTIKIGFALMRKLAFWLLPFAAGIVAAHAAAAPAPADTAAVLSSVDYNFVAQANLGAPFQIDSGRIAEQKGTTPALRDYAHLMVVSHVPVVDALNKVLQRKGLTAPPNPLLHGAYDAMINSLKADQGRAFDRDYVDGQVHYQEGNAALFRYEIENGTDSDLKEFARQTLPKIEDHLQRALKLAAANNDARPN
jgi:putative membrane protein